jgi:hypothetical protein
MTMVALLLLWLLPENTLLTPFSPTECNTLGEAVKALATARMADKTRNFMVFLPAILCGHEKRGRAFFEK